MIDASEGLLEDAIDMDEEAVAEAIEEVYMKNSSILRYSNENALSCIKTLHLTF